MSWVTRIWFPALLLLLAYMEGGALRAADPLEVPVWPDVAPGSEGITEAEIVVDRGEGKGYVDRSISSVHQPTITLHLPAKPSPKPSAAVVICPGGGLNRVVIDKEGHALAKLLVSHGVAGIVLKFRTVKSPKNHYGIAPPLADVQQAIRLTRARAEEWNLDPQRVGVFGFSAGGLIAANAAVHFDAGDQSSPDPVVQQSCRPDFLGLAYPLVSLQTDVVGEMYQQLTLGPNPPSEKIRFYSAELHVTPNAPPAFLAHAADDRGVKIENSRRYAAACRNADVPCTTYFRDKGGHGYGVRDLGQPIHQWPQAFVAWLKERGIAR